MTDREHAYRILRGALNAHASVEDVARAFEGWLHDETAIDRQPLLGWWQLGGGTFEEGR